MLTFGKGIEAVKAAEVQFAAFGGEVVQGFIEQVVIHGGSSFKGFVPRTEKDPGLPGVPGGRGLFRPYGVYGGCGSWTAVRVGAKLPPALLLLPR